MKIKCLAVAVLLCADESHGCVRTSPTGARYFYEISQRGDIVDVTGTTRRFAAEPYAGDWKFWTRAWTQWLAGSALSAR